MSAAELWQEALDMRWEWIEARADVLQEPGGPCDPFRAEGLWEGFSEAIAALPQDQVLKLSGAMRNADSRGIGDLLGTAVRTYWREAAIVRATEEWTPEKSQDMRLSTAEEEQ